MPAGRPKPQPTDWNQAEKKALDAHLKATYGLATDQGVDPPGFPCLTNARGVMYPGGYFYGCTKMLCKSRHMRTVSAAGGPYMDDSAAQLDACRALTPSWTAAIDAGTLIVQKIPKKSKS